MRLKINETIFMTEGVERTHYISQHTGDELENLVVEVIIKGRSKNSLFTDELLKTKNIVYCVDSENTVLKVYTVDNKIYSYIENPGDEEQTEYEYTLYLKEKEQLDIKRLIIGGLELEPYKYLEEVYKGKLLIHANVKVDRKELIELEKLLNIKDVYFEVIREGISKNKVEMTFGNILWSKNEGAIKLSLILFEKEEITYPQERPFINEIAISNLINEVYELKKLNNELIMLLGQKGIISHPDRFNIEQKSKVKNKNIISDFLKVKDIDNYEFY